jgi:mRNA-degrading endonuclease RelE of RelBE toxin-antitoxin system
MHYEILLAPQAVEDLDTLKAKVRALVRDAIEQHLRHQPTKVSKSRIKRLRGLTHPRYRLRVGDDIRVFCDVTEEAVQILAVVAKSAAENWLNEHGESDETGGSIGTEG